MAEDYIIATNINNNGVKPTSVLHEQVKEASYMSSLYCICPPLLQARLLVQHGWDDWSGKLSRIPCHHQPARNPKAANQTQQSLLGCIKSDMLWPHWAGVFHVDAAALDLEFQLIRLIENMHFCKLSFLVALHRLIPVLTSWMKEPRDLSLCEAESSRLGYYLHVYLHVSFTVLCYSTLQDVLNGLTEHKARVIFFCVIQICFVGLSNLLTGADWLDERLVKGHYV